MSKQLSRRKFIGSAAAASATIIGLDPRAQSWITPAQGQPQSFQGVPTLDGALLFDETSRKAIAVDKSNLFHRIPAAVLKPASIQDVVKIVQRSEEHTSELQSHSDLVCRLL